MPGRATFVVLGALSACLAAGYGVLFTITDDYTNEYGISDAAIGWLIGVGFVAGFASQLVLGPLADRGHARRVVALGVLVNVGGLLAMAFGTSLAVLLAGRIVSGFGIGAATPAIRRIAVLASPHQMGRNLGRLLAADVFGFALGPAISAALVGPFGIPAPFVVVSAASVALVVLALRIDIGRSAAATEHRLALDLLRDRVFGGAVVLGAAAFVMIGTFDALWSLVHDDLGTRTWMANLGITLFALPLVVLGPIGGRLAQRFGPFRFAAVGLVLGAGFLLAYGLVPTGTAIFSVSLGHAVSDGLTIAAAGIAVAMVTPEHRQAGAQGVLGAAQALGAGAIAPVVGWVYDASGRTAAYATGAGAMVLMVVTGYVLARPSWRLHH